MKSKLPLTLFFFYCTLVCNAVEKKWVSIILTEVMIIEGEGKDGHKIECKITVKNGTGKELKVKSRCCIEGAIYTVQKGDTETELSFSSNLAKNKLKKPLKLRIVGELLKSEYTNIVSSNTVKLNVR